MLEIIRKNKLLVSFFVLAYAIWIGGSLVRSIIAFSVFEPFSTSTLVRQVSNDILMQSVYLFSASASYTNVAYFVLLVIAIILFVRTRHLFKQEGWLMMSFILFFATAPIQLILIYFDANLSIEVFWNHRWEFYHPQILTYFLNRITNPLWNSLSGISFLANLTIVFLAVYQPLRNEK